MVSSLQRICQKRLIDLLEETEARYHDRLINELCKYLPEPLLEGMFEMLMNKGLITDVVLNMFLVPSRRSLKVCQALRIRNSTFKQIAYNCKSLVTLDLSHCSQVSNSVVRTILAGCPILEDISLNFCYRVTDAAFNFSENPFEALIGCLSLESINLQGLPQITGEIVRTLNKHCKQLKYLNLSQCKNIKSPEIQQVFAHGRLQSLNLAFIDICDEAFCLLPQLTDGSVDKLSMTTSDSFSSQNSCLEKLNVGNSRITDLSMYKMSNLIALLEISLQWCVYITDVGIDILTQNCPNLESIDLTSCRITNESLVSIANQSKKLKVLDLSWCQCFSSEGMLNFVNSANDDISLEGQTTHIVSTEDVNRARTSLERLKIVWCKQISDDIIPSLLALKSLKIVELKGSGITNSGFNRLTKKGIEVFS